MAPVLVMILSLVLLSSGCADAVGKVGSSPKPLSTPVGPLTTARTGEGETLLYFDPPVQQLEVGSSLPMHLRLENVSNLYGIEVHLVFDSRVVQVVDGDPSQDGVQISVGNLPSPKFAFQNMVDNFGGRLDYAVVASQGAVSGSGVVATLSFEGIGPGTSTIRFTGVKLLTPEGSEIPFKLQEGAVTVNGETVALGE
jgi:hypothetical protein